MDDVISWIWTNIFGWLPIIGSIGLLIYLIAEASKRAASGGKAFELPENQKVAALVGAILLGVSLSVIALNPSIRCELFGGEWLKPLYSADGVCFR